MTPVRAACPLCGGTSCEAVYDLSAASSEEDVPGVVMRCRDCPMWFKALSDPSAIPIEYAGEHGEDELARTYLVGDAARTLFRTVLARLDAGSPASRRRLLDIGCGQGVLLEEAARLGFEVEGIDRCAANVEAASAKGLRARLMDAEDLDQREAFDVITAMDLIEHVPDPMRVLAAAHRALKPGGELVVYTPNHRALVVDIAKLLHAVGIRSPVREIFGRNHVCFFDDRSLPTALDRTGFEMRLAEQLPYDTARPGQPMSPLGLAAVSIIERLGRPFDRAFRLLVYARKPARAGENASRPG